MTLYFPARCFLIFSQWTPWGWARRYGNLSSVLPRDGALDSNDQGVAPGIAKVRTIITTSILAWRGQVRNPSVSTKRLDVDRVVDCWVQWPSMEVMQVWSCWGIAPQRLRENVYLAPTLIKTQKVIWWWGRGPAKSPRGLR